MSNFTKGPWKIESHSCIVNLESKTIVDIAKVFRAYDGPLEREGFANAHLIASAPEMHEFIVTVLRVIKERPKEDWAECNLHILIAEKAERILAKAEGNQ
jgi:hypothetical protein